MRALVLVILASVVLQSGCSTKTVYRNPDATPERWARDSSECERDAGQNLCRGERIHAQFRDAKFLRPLPHGSRLDEDARIRLANNQDPDTLLRAPGARGILKTLSMITVQRGVENRLCANSQ